ncbi:MAG: polyhydroxyalkanoic acid system family protein [Aeoliella sp.]
MPKFNVSVPHTLGKEEVVDRMKHLLEKVTENFGDQVKNLEQSWEDDKLNFSFRTFGINVSGEGTADDSEVHITGNLPIAAMMFKGKIESGLKDQLTRMLK